MLVTAFVHYLDDQIKWNDIRQDMWHAWEINAYRGGVRKSEQTTWKIQSNDRIILKLNWTVGGQVDSSGSAQAQARIVVKITVNIWVQFFIRFQADSRY